jgi:hypothetical protein
MRKAGLVIAASLLISAQIALAQTPQQPQQHTPNAKQPPKPLSSYQRFVPPKPVPHDDKEFKREILTRPPDLADLPPYGGNAKFSTGTVSPNAKGGTAFYIIYTSEDPKETVVNWYQQALSNSKWQIGSMRAGVGLDATKGPNYCSVNVTTASSPKSRCDFTVFYRQVKDQNGR